jgi:hypothetical protein
VGRGEVIVWVKRSEWLLVGGMEFGRSAQKVAVPES